MAQRSTSAMISKSSEGSSEPISELRARARAFDARESPMNDLHPSTEEALEEIDAAVFSGDPDIVRERLLYYIERWQKALEESADSDE